MMVGTANAATLFSDDFNDGNANGWSTSGGTWSVVVRRLLRSPAPAPDAKAQAGSTSWTDVTVSGPGQADAFGSDSSRGGRHRGPRAEHVELLRPRADADAAVQLRKGAGTTPRLGAVRR